MLFVIIYLLGMCAVFITTYEHNKTALLGNKVSIGEAFLVSFTSWVGVFIIIFARLVVNNIDIIEKLNDWFIGRKK